MYYNYVLEYRFGIFLRFFCCISGNVPTVWYLSFHFLTISICKRYK